eukprot:gene7001-7788_t
MPRVQHFASTMPRVQHLYKQYVATFCKRAMRGTKQDSPEDENFAVDAEEDKTTKLGPMQQCLWDWLVCWSSKQKSSSRCGWDYADCTKKAKGTTKPNPPPLPPTET